MAEHLLEVRDLRVSFDTYAGEVQAVRGVDFCLDRGESLTIVGESGCGKSVTLHALMRLNPEPPARIKAGEILYDGQNLVQKTDREMRSYRGKELAMIFQDAMTSLNPVARVGRQMTEAIRLHKKNVTAAEAKSRAVEMLGRVGLPDPAAVYRRYPHTLSGGQRQRVMIAMALCCHPSILLADEPTTALDVTTQAQILQVMGELQKDTGCGIILVTHNLGVVARMAHRVAVMYAGQIVEQGALDDIFYRPKHPYTWGLLGAMPDMQEDRESRLTSIPGSPPDLFAPPAGCAFAARCPYCMEVCLARCPVRLDVAQGHSARCWLLDERAGNRVAPPAGEDRTLVTEDMRQYINGKGGGADV